MSPDRGPIRDFRDLLIWQRAMEIARFAYRLSGTFPAAEQFGLTSQLRRSAVSAPSNIAEGHGRETPGDFDRFLRIARGSLSELQTQVILASHLGYCSAEDVDSMENLINELGRMMPGMQNSLNL